MRPALLLVLLVGCGAPPIVHSIVIPDAAEAIEASAEAIAPDASVEASPAVEAGTPDADGPEAAVEASEPIDSAPPPPPPTDAEDPCNDCSPSVPDGGISITCSAFCYPVYCPAACTTPPPHPEPYGFDQDFGTSGASHYWCVCYHY